MKKFLIIVLAVLLSFTACTNRTPIWILPPGAFYPEKEPEPDGECNHAELINITEWFDTEHHYPKAGTCAWCDEEIKRETIEIGTADELAKLGEDLSKFYDIGCYTISITDDIDMSGKTWPYIYLDGYDSNHYNGKDFIINGNEHSIENLSTGNTNTLQHSGLIARMWSAVTLEINKLTLSNAKISAGIPQDEELEPGVGGFVGVIDSSASVKFNDCHVIDSTISGGHWAGGIYGYASGWSRKDDGPVATYIEISDCSVEGTTISSEDASTGGVMGHAGGDKDTFITVKNTNVNGCTITSTENGTVIKAGHVMGTNGVGQTTLEKVTFDNTVTSDDTPVSREYGRLAFAGAGSLTIDGKKITES